MLAVGVVCLCSPLSYQLILSPQMLTQIGLPGYASMPAALAAMTRQERATYCNGHWGQEWRKLYTLEFSRWVDTLHQGSGGIFTLHMQQDGDLALRRAGPSAMDTCFWPLPNAGTAK